MRLSVDDFTNGAAVLLVAIVAFKLRWLRSEDGKNAKADEQASAGAADGSRAGECSD